MTLHRLATQVGIVNTMLYLRLKEDAEQSQLTMDLDPFTGSK